MDEDTIETIITHVLNTDWITLPEQSIYNDPDFQETCRKSDEVMHQIRKEFPKDEYKKIKNLMALRAKIEAYRRLEFFRAGLSIGAEMYGE